MKSVLLTLSVVLCALLFFCFRERKQSITVSAFNTVCSVHTWSRRNPDKARQGVPALLQQYHSLLKAYDPASELSRLNAAASEAPFPCSPEMWDVLQMARRAHELTDGAFDITVGPLMELWGYHGKRKTLPSEEEVQAALKQVGLPKVIFDDTAHTVRFTVPGMRLDFGGIAKGYACHIVSAHLLRHGISCFLLDFGGNLCLSKKAPSGKGTYTIGIRDPNARQENVTARDLRGVTIATSGNYERSQIIDGVRVGHIMDPRTGRPGLFFQSITAITPDATFADVLSTAIFIGGKPLAEKAMQRLPGTTFIVVDKDGKLQDWN